jgi:hypothetical protein
MLDFIRLPGPRCRGASPKRAMSRGGLIQGLAKLSARFQVGYPSRLPFGGGLQAVLWAWRGDLALGGMG